MAQSIRWALFGLVMMIGQSIIKANFKREIIDTKTKGNYKNVVIRIISRLNFLLNAKTVNTIIIKVLREETIFHVLTAQETFAFCV